MKSKQIDLSGINGLSTLSGENLDKDSIEPHLAYIAGEGQMVDGIYNAFRKYGYMSPSVSSSRDVVPALGSFEGNITAHTYDPESNKLYFTDDNSIWVADGLDDVSPEQFLEVDDLDYELNTNGIHFVDNGNILYLITSAGLAYQFNLSTPYDANTATYEGMFDFSFLANGVFRQIQLKPDGTKLFIFFNNAFTVYEFDLEEAFKLSTCSYTGNSITFSDNDLTMTGFFIHETASTFSDRFFVLLDDATGQTIVSRIAEYVLKADGGESWTLEFGLGNELSTSDFSDDTIRTNLVFDSDGSRFYCTNGPNIEQYSVGTNWTVDTITYEGNCGGEFIMSGSNNNFYLRPDTEATIFTVTSDTITEWNMSISNSITTISEGISYDITGDTFLSFGDIEIYTLNGRKALYYSYNTGGLGLLEGQIGVYTFHDQTQNDKWLFDTANFIDNSISEKVQFEISANGFMYAISDVYVYRIDGSDFTGEEGSVTEMLRFDGGFITDDILDHRGYIYIPVHQGNITNLDANFSNRVGVFQWNRTSRQNNMRDFISIQGAKQVKAVFSAHDGNIMCITVGSNNKTQIRILERNAFPIIQELERNAFPPSSDAVTKGQNASWWVGSNGIVYSYGKIGPGDENAFYRLGSPLTDANPSPGMFFYGGGSAGSVTAPNSGVVESFYVSDNANGTKMQLWAPHANSDGDYPDQKIVKGDVFTRVVYLPQMSNLKMLKIYCARTELNDSTVLGTVKFYANQNNTPFMTKDIKAIDTSRGYIEIGLDKQFVNAFQLEVEWNDTLSLSDDVFYPSQAVLHYEPTSTKG